MKKILPMIAVLLALTVGAQTVEEIQEVKVRTFAVRSSQNIIPTSAMPVVSNYVWQVDYKWPASYGGVEKRDAKRKAAVTVTKQTIISSLQGGINGSVDGKWEIPAYEIFETEMSDACRHLIAGIRATKVSANDVVIIEQPSISLPTDEDNVLPNK